MTLHPHTQQAEGDPPHAPIMFLYLVILFIPLATPCHLVTLFTRSLRVEIVDAFFDICAIACNKAPLWKKP